MKNPTLRALGSGQRNLVLVHGFPLDATMWSAQEGLADFARLITFDLPGFGEAAALPTPSSIAALAQEVLEALDHFRLEEAILCGLSMGGYLLFECWRRFPQRISGLVLCDTRAEADSEEGRSNRDTAIAMVREGQRDELTEGLLPKLLSPETQRDNPLVVERLRQMMRRASNQALIAALIAMKARPDSTATLHTIDVPTLVVVGVDDQLAPPDAARAMERRIQRGQLVEIPRAGHMAPLENPAAFNRALRTWLATVG